MKKRLYALFLAVVMAVTLAIPLVAAEPFVCDCEPATKCEDCNGTGVVWDECECDDDPCDDTCACDANNTCINCNYKDCDKCEDGTIPGEVGEGCEEDCQCVTCAVCGKYPANTGSSSSSSSSSAPAEPTPAPVPAAVASAARGATVSVSGLASAPVSVEQLNSYTDLVANNTNGFNTTYGIPASAQVAALFNLNLKKGTTIPDGGLIVPISVRGAQAGDYVIVMHRKADGIWEVVGRGFLGDNRTINATFTSFSPVMVLKVDAADVATTGIRAPKTGE